MRARQAKIFYAGSPPNPLLVRIRYSNPLPPPPFPPKLLTVKTDPARYSGYNFLSAYENEREVPVSVDGDGGMHIELGLETDGTYGQGRYWQGDRSGGPRHVLAPVAEADTGFSHLWRPQQSAAARSRRPGFARRPGPLLDPGPAERQWRRNLALCRSEHRKAARRRCRRRVAAQDRIFRRRFRPPQRGHVRPRPLLDRSVKADGPFSSPQKRVVLQPRSREERFEVIEKTFLAADSPLSDLRHPLKSHVRATAAYPLLPNTRLWSNTYQLHRFMENPSDERAAPGAVGTVGSDPRLAAAVIRPVVVKGEPRMVYYLPRDENEVAEYKRRKLEMPDIDETADDEEVMDDGFRVRSALRSRTQVKAYRPASSRSTMSGTTRLAPRTSMGPT